MRCGPCTRWQTALCGIQMLGPTPPETDLQGSVSESAGWLASSSCTRDSGACEREHTIGESWCAGEWPLERSLLWKTFIAMDSGDGVILHLAGRDLTEYLVKNLAQTERSSLLAPNVPVARKRCSCQISLVKEQAESTAFFSR